MDYEIEQACDPEANGGDEQTIDRIGKRLCEGNGKIEQRGHGQTGRLARLRRAEGHQRVPVLGAQQPSAVPAQRQPPSRRRSPVTPVPVRDAATVMLVRDGERGLEVFMLRRSLRLVFAGGAHVFPGGALDPSDGSDAVARHCEGFDDGSASKALRGAYFGNG